MNDKEMKNWAWMIEWQRNGFGYESSGGKQRFEEFGMNKGVTNKGTMTKLYQLLKRPFMLGCSKIFEWGIGSDKGMRKWVSMNKKVGVNQWQINENLDIAKLYHSFHSHTRHPPRRSTPTLIPKGTHSHFSTFQALLSSQYIFRLMYPHPLNLTIH